MDFSQQRRHGEVERVSERERNLPSIAKKLPPTEGDGHHRALYLPR